MKTIISVKTLSLLVSTAVLLSGCGTYNAKKGKDIKLTTGNAESVSGADVETKQVSEEKKLEKLGHCGAYSCNCSENYVYFADCGEGDAEEKEDEKEAVLQQFDFSASLAKEYPLDFSTEYGNKDLEISVELVQDGELYCSVSSLDKNGDPAATDLWKIPLKQNGQEEEPDLSQKELLLADSQVDAGTGDIWFIGKDIIAGISWDGYWEYDREIEKEIPIDRDSDRKYNTTVSLGPPVCQFTTDTGISGGKYILLAEARERNEVGTGLYIHEIGSGRVVKLCDQDYSRYAPEPIAFLGESACYYTCQVQGRPESPDYDYDVAYDIMSYDYATGEKSCLIAQKDWQDWLKGLHFPSLEGEHPIYSSCKIGTLYLFGGRLYVSALIPHDCDSYFCVWFSISLEEKTLRYEKKMTKACQNVGGLTLFANMASGSKICLDAHPESSYDQLDLFDLQTGKMTKVYQGVTIQMSIYNSEKRSGERSEETEEFMRWQGVIRKNQLFDDLAA